MDEIEWHLPGEFVPDQPLKVAAGQTVYSQPLDDGTLMLINADTGESQIARRPEGSAHWLSSWTVPAGTSAEDVLRNLRALLG